MENIYVISECQNGYQEERVINFVRSQKARISNKNFNYHFGKGYLYSRKCGNVALEDVVRGRTDKIIKKADEVWVILGGSCCYVTKEEERKVRRKLKLKVRYFKINQGGRYIGRAHEVKRRELLV